MMLNLVQSLQMETSAVVCVAIFYNQSLFQGMQDEADFCVDT